jgi:hypothetical protein
VSGLSWAEFVASDMAFAEAGARLLFDAEGVAVAYLATADADGVPHLGPVCPVFSRGRLFLVAAGGTPKVRDLRAGGGYALHAPLGERDEEFQLGGQAREVMDGAERAAVQADIPFPSWNPDDPIFELRVSRALHVVWEGHGETGMQRLAKRWPR